MTRALRAAFIVAVWFPVVAVAASTADVYVWQREWTPAVRAALDESRADFAGVRVLVAQSDRAGHWHATSADPRVFVDDPRKRIAVVRYDGAGVAPDPAALIAFANTLATRWRDVGAPLAGIEIDYDCASSRLADYATRLRAIRPRLPNDWTLSITALPAWIGSASLDAVTDAIDEPVLQVHAVQSPDRGLFDAALAERWVRAFAPHAPHGFRVAVPAYESRIRFDEAGAVVAVENEVPVDAARDPRARDVRVDPAAVVALWQNIEASPPLHWNGFVWFRLPNADDQRAWTLTAIRDVMAGKVPFSRISVRAVARAGGASDIVVSNEGDAGGPAPSIVVTGRDCTAADGANGWHAERDANGWRFTADASRWLRAATETTAGWVRCESVGEARVE